MACHLFGGIIYRWSMGFSSQRSKNVKCVSISWRYHWMICRISTQFVVDNVWNWNHNFVWEVAWTYTRAATPAGWYAWRCGGPTVGGKPPGAVSLLHKRYHVSKTTVHSMGLLPDMQNCRLRMRRGMPGTFPPLRLRRNRQLAILACITTRASRTCRDAYRDRWPAVARKRFLAFSAHAQAVILRIWQEAHDACKW